MAADVVTFRDRRDAGLRLAALLKELGDARPFTRPLVLGIPRGGVVIGEVLARELGAELDVVFARKLRAPEQPELAIGAIGEDGSVYLNEEIYGHELGAYLEAEKRVQLEEIARRSVLVRSVRPAAEVADRTVIITDDGLATGSTMIAALRSLRGRQPRDLIMAVPVAPSDRLEEVRPLCDYAVCVLTPRDFWAIGQFYENFEPVEDDRMLACLRGSSV